MRLFHDCFVTLLLVRYHCMIQVHAIHLVFMFLSKTHNSQSAPRSLASFYNPTFFFWAIQESSSQAFPPGLFWKEPEPHIERYVDVTRCSLYTSLHGSESLRDWSTLPLGLTGKYPASILT